jgi:uncharacterized RDD family membrane protein YckC
MEEQKETSFMLASRKQRFCAFIIDVLILGIIGYVSGFLFEDIYMKLGNYGRIIGTLLTLLYFGICDSKITNGQTIGKKILKIKVVDKKSQCVTVPRSLIRSLWIVIWILLNGLSFSNSKFVPILIIIGTILFSIGLLEIYFFIANKQTLQTLHDLIFNTYVVSISNNNEILSVNKKSVIYCSSIIPVIILLLAIVINLKAKKTYLNDMMVLIDVIQKELPVHQTTISRNTNVLKTLSGETKTKYILVTSCKNNKTDDDKILASKIAKIILTSDFKFNENESLSIVIVSGYNIGIASKKKSQSYNGTIDQWKTEILKVGSNKRFNLTLLLSQNLLRPSASSRKFCANFACGKTGKAG